jgi:hypothetical protein
MAVNLGRRCEFGQDCDNNDVFRLSECIKDTSSHLRMYQSNCKLLNGVILPEACLIMNRNGVFSPVQFSKYICRFHRDSLGLYWKRPSRVCAHPLHGDSKSKPDRGITYLQSREIWLKLSKKVPVGSGKLK